MDDRLYIYIFLLIAFFLYKTILITDAYRQSRSWLKEFENTIIPLQYSVAREATNISVYQDTHKWEKVFFCCLDKSFETLSFEARQLIVEYLSITQRWFVLPKKYAIIVH